MDALRAGQLVTVATGGPELDGIVFDVPSPQKLVVAVVDAQRGPVLRTVAVDTVSEREEAGPRDAALQGLIRRTPPAARGAGAAGKGAVQARRGHVRGAAHRSTGR